MGPADPPLTVPASVPQPYVHVDNRAFVLHDGRACVMYSRATFRWLAQTLQVLIDERRATRQQGAQVFGGFLLPGGGATLYAGTPQGLVTCDVGEEGLRSLLETLAAR